MQLWVACFTTASVKATYGRVVNELQSTLLILVCRSLLAYIMTQYSITQASRFSTM